MAEYEMKTTDMHKTKKNVEGYEICISTLNQLPINK